MGGLLGGISQLLGGTALSSVTWQQGAWTVQQFYTVGGGTMQMAGYSPATWASWNQVYVAGANITNAQWGAWNQLYFQQTMATTQQQVAYVEPSPEQIMEMQVQAQRHAQEAAQAKVRAETLLLDCLDERQRESYKKNHLFIVETPKKNRYKLSLASQPRKLEGEREVVSYCIHTYGVPREDELLGFKLLLEANEDEFLKTANATRLAA